MSMTERFVHRSEPAHALRLGCVSFLNAKPLIYGLEHDPSLPLSLDVPSRLIEGLRDHRYDVALLPVIDFQRLDGLVVVPSGGIGCGAAGSDRRRCHFADP